MEGMDKHEERVHGYLIAEGFVRTEGGNYVRIDEGVPLVIKYDTGAPERDELKWFCDKPGHSTWVKGIAGIQQFIHGEV